MPEFVYSGNAVVAEPGETVLDALLRNGQSVDHGCKSGSCQRCLVKAAQGHAPGAATRGLDSTVVEDGGFLSCQAPAGSVPEVMPADSAPRYEAVLVEHRWLSRSVLLLRWLAQGLEAKPGQFVRLISPSGVNRSYSLVSCEDGVIELHLRVLPDGAMSTCLRDARLGDRYSVEGPFGKCTYRTNYRERPILLIGSGTGLAPLVGIARQALLDGHQGGLHLYHGSATSEGLYFREELAEIEGLQVTSCADQVTDLRDHTGSPLALALQDHPNLSGWAVYLCGAPELVRAAQKKCFLAGADLQHIYADAFADQSLPSPGQG